MIKHGTRLKRNSEYARTVYTVERVDTYRELEYALLTWVKNTGFPGAQWESIKNIDDRYKVVDP